MAKYRRSFRCEVITPEGPGFSGELVSAVFPAPDGLVGVLGGRGPMVTVLGSGPLTVQEAHGGRSVYFVTGGFAQFRRNVLTVLTGECLVIDRIDPEAAWREIQQAQSLPRETPPQKEAREEALQAARAKFKLAQKHREEAGSY